MAYFPMFVEIEDRPCLVAGGGMVALRKVEKLLEFQARVTVIAPKIIPKLKELAAASGGRLCLIQREFVAEDVRDCFLVIAATDDHVLNHQIAEAARAAGIPVNAVDQKEDCSFMFSSMVKKGDLVAAFSSSGKSPIVTQYLKAQMEEQMTDYLGQVNDLLGRYRSVVKARFETEAERKEAFRRIFELCMEGDKLPADSLIEQIVSNPGR